VLPCHPNCSCNSRKKREYQYSGSKVEKLRFVNDCRSEYRVSCRSCNSRSQHGDLDLRCRFNRSRGDGVGCRTNSRGVRSRRSVRCKTR
jgi:hypothetical protein